MSGVIGTVIGLIIGFLIGSIAYLTGWSDGWEDGAKFICTELDKMKAEELRGGEDGKNP